jgi:hypothetical protein
MANGGRHLLAEKSEMRRWMRVAAVNDNGAI